MKTRPLNGRSFYPSLCSLPNCSRKLSFTSLHPYCTDNTKEKLSALTCCTYHRENFVFCSGQTLYPCVRLNTPVVQTEDSSIHWINHYLLEVLVVLIQWEAIHPVDSRTNPALTYGVCLSVAALNNQTQRRKDLRHTNTKEYRLKYTAKCKPLNWLIYLTTTSFTGSLFFPLSRSRGREGERP